MGTEIGKNPEPHGRELKSGAAGDHHQHQNDDHLDEEHEGERPCQQPERNGDTTEKLQKAGQIGERHGRLERTDVRFQNDRHLLQVIDRIVSAVGRRIDDSSPMVDARLPDGSRVNAIIKPLAIDGPHLSIRKFKRDALSVRAWRETDDVARRAGMAPDDVEAILGLLHLEGRVVRSPHGWRTVNARG